MSFDGPAVGADPAIPVTELVDDGVVELVETGSTRPVDDDTVVEATFPGIHWL